MSETGPESGGAASAEKASGSRLRTMHWGYAVVPAATFVVGLLIGALVTGAGSDSGDEPAATETVSVSPSPSESADTEVRVPRECVEAAETAEEATQLILDNLSAIQDFQGQRIIDMLDRLEELSGETRELSKSCSDIDVSSVDASPTNEVSPEAEASPTS